MRRQDREIAGRYEIWGLHMDLQPELIRYLGVKHEDDPTPWENPDDDLKQCLERLDCDPRERLYRGWLTLGGLSYRFAQKARAGLLEMHGTECAERDIPVYKHGIPKHTYFTPPHPKISRTTPDGVTVLFDKLTQAAKSNNCGTAAIRERCLVDGKVNHVDWRYVI